MKTRKFIIGAAVAVATLVAGCGTTNQPINTYPPSSNTAASGYGVVESIQPVAASRSGPGLGTIAGGVIGGVLGNQIGSGTGRTAATAAGVIGGAVVGNQVEQRRGAQASAYQVGVRMNNGSYATLTQENISNIAVGDRVRVENGLAVRY
ncbi:glycine zipper 2TM domain-containing protein [Lacisediminimonas sp.]|uniref:glycine zipper 2TM domain-containing protein n=1 Tax=Lacisediminimonas sp. TaxID=3060582 RepID=UPI002726C617|nr:glycine zipper 2TM domain-containing protein [Lacisediminimonas sp.]MDO8300731.1 glycine zipper 2TM domain-containing protein [Lacisediminimonas sp.]MDO9219043.1 glycine zipper 2TM domain-containing protein [Lacisediminimonas sp.]